MHCLNNIISTITVLSKSINIYWSSLSHLASFGSFSIKAHLNNSMVFFWMSSFLNVPLSTLAISSLAPLMVYSTHLTVSLVTSMSLFNIGTVLNLSWFSSYCTFSNLFFFLPFFFLSFISLPFSHQCRQNMIIKKTSWLHCKVYNLPRDVKLNISFIQTNDNFQVAAVLVNLQATFWRQQMQHSKDAKTTFFYFQTSQEKQSDWNFLWKLAALHPLF